MTKQQLKDYDKVVTTGHLDVYLDTNPIEYGVDHPVNCYEDIPLRCALSDMDTFIDNWTTELNLEYFDDEDPEDVAREKELRRRIRAAKWFIKKYGGQK